LLPSWRCCFLSKQGNHAHARKHFLVALIFPFQRNVYAFLCGAIVSLPIKRYCQ
jgi:hypothetical protein